MHSRLCPQSLKYRVKLFGLLGSGLEILNTMHMFKLCALLASCSNRVCSVCDSGHRIPPDLQTEKEQ